MKLLKQWASPLFSIILLASIVFGLLVQAAQHRHSSDILIDIGIWLPLFLGFDYVKHQYSLKRAWREMAEDAFLIFSLFGTCFVLLTISHIPF